MKDGIGLCNNQPYFLSLCVVPTLQWRLSLFSQIVKKCHQKVLDEFPTSVVLDVNKKKNPQEQDFFFVYIRNFNSNVTWKFLSVNRNIGDCFHVLHPKLLIVEIRLPTYCLHVDNHLAAPWMNEYVHSCNYSRMLSIHICITTWCIPNFDVTHFELEGVYIMAILVVDFSREGYKSRKVFG